MLREYVEESSSLLCPLFLTDLKDHRRVQVLQLLYSNSIKHQPLSHFREQPTFAFLQLLSPIYDKRLADSEALRSCFAKHGLP